MDCDVCQEYQCFDSDEDGDAQYNENGDEVIDFEDLADWVAGLMECQETGAEYNGMSLYAGFICNGDGSGVDIGLFLDEECTIYTTLESYKNVADEDDYPYIYQSSEIVTYPFENPISCADRLLYAASWYQATEDQYNYPSYTCRQVFAGDYTLEVNDCNGDGQNDYANEYVEQEEYNENYYWYTYVLSQNDLGSPSTICSVVQAMNGEYTYVYNDTDGGIYTYTNTGKRGGSSTVNRGFLPENDSLAAGVIGALIMLVALALGGVIWVVQYCTADETEPVDPKEEKFIVTEEGEGKTIT